MKPITIAYVTNRANPMWEWFIWSLAAQTTPQEREQIELLFIDSHAWNPKVDYTRYFSRSEIPLDNPAYHDSCRHQPLLNFIDGHFPHVVHVPPKPCAYQGPFRQTKKDYFCAANTRNTAFIVAKHDYIVFVDDLSVLMPGWLDQVKHAAQDGYVAAGMYRKAFDLHVPPEGQPASYRAIASTDSRWDRGSDGGAVRWHGSGLFGCSFGVPLEAALEVDGNDAACNGGGAEDTDFGIRLERAGWAVYLNRNMLTLEDEGRHHDGSKLPQERRLVTKDRLPPNYESYHHAKPDERYWSDHVMLNRLNNEDRTLPILGDDLRAQRKHYQATGLVAVPAPNQVDWRDGTPLSEL